MDHKTATADVRWLNPAHSLTRRQFVAQSTALLSGLTLARTFVAPSLLGSRDAHDVAHAQIHGREASLENGAIAATWRISPQGLSLLQVHNRATGQTIASPRPAFRLTLVDGSGVESSAMRLLQPPRIESLAVDPQAARLSERLSGRAITASFEDTSHGLRAVWRAVLRDGARYIRQEVEISASREALPLAAVTLLDLDMPGAEVMGRVNGSPAAAGPWFFGFEHPSSTSEAVAGRLRSSLQRKLPLQPGRSASYSSVIGVAASGQLRRDFLGYIERERAHPYRTFLHYNSWFDLGYFTPYDQAGALDVIRGFGQQLATKRGVVLDSFLFDDGWDNHQSLWGFNSGFPDGFGPLVEAARTYHAAPGVWLSPWGGYDGPRKERLEYGQQQGYEENSGGFVLSGPRYFQRFREVCLEMIRKYGVNQFKFDGTGNASSAFPGSVFDSDFAAMISLIGDLRAAEPKLYVNLTSGTYPSPFWLRYADSIWRGGEDTSFAGVGSKRQQWITYRDADTYEHVLRRGPLYPLNSLMLHGLVYAQHAKNLSEDPEHDFSAEIRSYFASGTQLQEMYITHSLLADSDWDNLAAAARWSRRNADILVDTHWIGGDPAKLEIYGWASWASRGGIVTLRNPDNRPQSFDVDVQSAFELPSGAPENYAARKVWGSASEPAIELRAGRPRTMALQPFEVLTLEAAPR